MSKRCYYEVLSISKSATDGEIKKSYRRLAMKYHPDRNLDDKNTEVKFKEAKEAYEILSDNQKRQIYDQYGHAGLEQNTGHGDAGNFGDVFNDIFGDIFGSGEGRRGRQGNRGNDLQYNLELTLEEAVSGTESKIKIPTSVSCTKCYGHGTKDGKPADKCSTCNGIGQVRMQQGFFTVQQTCPTCQGNGLLIKQHCRTCQGKGSVKEYKTLSVKIPAGVDNGNRIVLSDEGQAGRNSGPPGDLFVQIHVKEHPIFSRENNHLSCEVPISIPTAALGGTLEVPTLAGHVALKIPAETQTGKMFRLRGKGIKSIQSGATGDLKCRVIIETPINLTREQKELLEKFEESLRDKHAKHSPKKHSWLDGVKKFFDDVKF